MQKFKQMPLPLISIDSEQRYTVGKEALGMIQSLSGKIAVISVVGLYRTGKSYLLNRMLLNRSNGFGVGSTIQACTKGIWIWGKPLVQKINDEVVNVLVIDSEGLGSLSEEANHDTKIFALTLLFSSLFIYNSVGSIDENTLSGLGVIVNLSKHLKIKSNSEQITDTEEFPHLFWVVRDFSLQLVDKEGKEITQNQYLENSLNVQPGSADADGRNEVRKGITRYFRDRDCVTLVRPSTEQEQLQHLDQADLDSLKPQFVEQMLKFRKKVMSSLVPKTLYGKPLTGITFCEMLYSFTDSINTGGIPTIETTWKYICQQQSLRAFQKSLQYFDLQIHEHVKRRIPMAKDAFAKETSNVRAQTQSLFSKLVGENRESEEYLSELNQRMDSKIELLRSDNRLQNVKAAQEFVSNEFQSIERKIRNQEYKKIGQLVKEIQLFQEYYKKKCPYQQAQAQSAIGQFLFRKLSEGALLISKQMSQAESEMIKMKGKDVEAKCQQEIEEIKERATKEKSELLGKISLGEKVKENLESRVEGLVEEIERYRQSLENVTKEKETLQSSQKRESNKSVSELKSTISRLEMELEDCKVEKNERLSSQDREILLLRNRVEYYEKNNQQLQLKSQESDSLLKRARAEYDKSVKEFQNKYETSRNALNCKIRNLQSLLEERINELAMSEAQKCVLESRIQDLEQRNKSLKDSSEHTLKEMKEELLMEKQSQIQRIYKEMSSTSSEWSSKIRRLESQSSEKESLNKQLKLELEKEVALFNQKIEFLETESSEKNETINKLNSEYLGLMLILESKDDEISQLQGELKAIDQESHKGSMEAQHQLTLLRDTLTLKHSQVVDLSQEIESLRDTLKSLETSNSSCKEESSILEEQLRAAESLRKQTLQQQEGEFKQQLKRLSVEFETQKQEEKDRTDQMLKNNERTLIQLKNFYEMEKERNQKKLFEETQKVSVLENQTLVQLRDQYNMLARTTQEEVAGLMEELKETKGRLKENEESLSRAIEKNQSTLDQELQEKCVVIEELKRKESLGRDELRKVQRQFQEERVSFVKKVDAITFDLSRKEKQILQLTSKKESYEQQLAKREQQMGEVKREYQEEQRLSDSRIEELKHKLQLLKDEHIELKIESEKELALARQKNQFLSSKVSELIKERELLSSKNLAEKPQLDKNQLYKQQYQKAEQEIISLENKLDKARKATREGEAHLAKQLTALEKEKLALQERLSSAEDKLRYSNLMLSTKVGEYQKEIDELKEKLSLDKSSLSLEYDKLKQENTRKGNEITQLQSQIQRETSLLEQKIRFIENQKDQLRRELEESRKKLEFMMNQLQKGRKPEEDEERKQLQNQKKLNSQLQILKESLRRKTEQAEESHLKYKAEVKQLKDKNSELQERMIRNEKQHKINQLLVEENEKLKKERDEIFLSNKAELSRESEESRRKLGELEKKCKNSEKKSAQQIFNYEKEKAKWNMEKDSMSDKVAELEERLKNKEHASLLEKKSSDKYKPFTANHQMMKSMPYFDRNKE